MKKLTALLMAVLMTATVFVGCGSSSKSEKETSAYQKTVEEFIDYISDKKCEEAESMLTFTNAPVKSASFQNFANNQLKNLTFEITDESDEKKIEVTLSSDTETFEVYLIPNGKEYKILADDFLMDYKVQYISCLSSSHNNFTGKGEYIGNGIQQYEVYIYKADTVTLEHTMLFNDDSIVPNIKTQISFNENYEPSEIISVTNYLDSEESYPGYVVLKDDVVFVDTYGITEDYSRHLATKFSSVMDSMIGHAIDGSTYDDFSVWNADSIIKDSASIRSYYNDFVNMSDQFYTDTEFDTVVETWNYDKYYHLGDPYIMTINASLHVGNTVGETATFYVRFVPDEDYFKIDAIGDTYAAVSGETTEQQEKPDDSEPSDTSDWQNAYLTHIDEMVEYGYAENLECALIYIDDDAIPELITKESPLYYTASLYINGKVQSLACEGSFEGYIPGSGRYGTRAITMDSLTDDFFNEYEIRKNDVNFIVSHEVALKCVVTETSDIGEPMAWYCEQNSEQITKTEYDAKCLELVNSYTQPVFYSYDEMREMLMAEDVPTLDSPAPEIIWQDAYKEVVDAFEAKYGENCIYEIIYIDNDNVPELYMHRQEDDQATELYTFYNNQAVRVLEGSSSYKGFYPSYCIERSGELWALSDSSTDRTFEHFKLTEGKLVLIESVVFESYDGYTINGETVSEADFYQKNLEQFDLISRDDYEPLNYTRNDILSIIFDMQ